MKMRAMLHSYAGAVFSGAFLLLAAGASAQNLFVSCAGNGSIVEITPGGAETTFATGLDAPNGLAFDSNGDLFEADEGTGNIYEFVNNGGVLSSTPLLFASGLGKPFGLAFNPGTGNLFVSEYANDDITQITPGGSVSVFVTGLGGPEGIAFLGTTELLVANQMSNTVDEISMTGQLTTYTTGLSSPSGIALNGNIPYVANQQGNSIYDLGQVAGQRPRTLISGLNDPNGLAFNGNVLYEADTGSGQINEITQQISILHGDTVTETTFASNLDEPVGLAFQPVPEPSALGLLAVGAMGLLGWGLRVNGGIK